MDGRLRRLPGKRQNRGEGITSEINAATDATARVMPAARGTRRNGPCPARSGILRAAALDDIDEAAEIRLRSQRSRPTPIAMPWMLIIEIHSSGRTSLGEIAAEMNNRGIPTPRRRQWQPMTLSNLLARVRRLL